MCEICGCNSCVDRREGELNNMYKDEQGGGYQNEDHHSAKGAGSYHVEGWRTPQKVGKHHRQSAQNKGEGKPQHQAHHHRAKQQHGNKLDTHRSSFLATSTAMASLPVIAVSMSRTNLTIP